MPALRLSVSASTVAGTITAWCAVAGSTVLYAIMPGGLTAFSIAATLAVALGYTGSWRDAGRWLTANLTLTLTVSLLMAHAALTFAADPSTVRASSAVALVTLLAMTAIARPTRSAMLTAFVVLVTLTSIGGVIVWPLVQFGLVGHADWPVPAWLLAEEGAARTGWFSMPFGLSTAITGATFAPFRDLRWIQVGGMSFEPANAALLAVLAFIAAPLTLLPRRAVLAVRVVLAAFVVMTGSVTGWLALPVVIVVLADRHHPLRRMAWCAAGLGISLAVMVIAQQGNDLIADIPFKMAYRSRAELWPWTDPSLLTVLIVIAQLALAAAVAWAGTKMLRACQTEAGLLLVLIAAASLRSHDALWLLPAVPFVLVALLAANARASKVTQCAVR